MWSTGSLCAMIGGGNLCVHMYFVCVSEHCSKHELITIIKNGYIMKFAFYKIHFSIQRVPWEELYIGACVDVNIIAKMQ